MTTSTYQVTGMTVTSDTPLADDAVASALDEAGDYRLATG